MRTLFAVLLLGLPAPALAAPVLDTPVKDDFWAAGRAALAERLAVVNRPKRAKNVILMIGDGMGISTITAARIYDGQNPGDGKPRRSGEENSLSFERLPHTRAGQDLQQQCPGARQRRHCQRHEHRRQDADRHHQLSARTSSPKPARRPKNCRAPSPKSPRGRAWPSASSPRRGITHATPAAVYGHVPSRNWEGADRAFPAADRKAGCPDLASQLVGFAPRRRARSGAWRRPRPLPAACRWRLAR